jgi:hypothetical protein
MPAAAAAIRTWRVHAAKRFQGCTHCLLADRHSCIRCPDGEARHAGVILGLVRRRLLQQLAHQLQRLQQRRDMMAT